MLSPLIVLLGSQLFKGEFWLSTNKLLLAVHNDLLNVSSGCQRGLCRVSGFRNHDHSLFPIMGKIILFITVYKSSSWWKLRNRLMYLLIWLFITLWRCYFRNFWTLKRQKKTKKHKHSLIWKKCHHPNYFTKEYELLKELSIIKPTIYVLLNYN